MSLADTPPIETRTIDRLIEAYGREDAVGVVLALADGRRRNRCCGIGACSGRCGRCGAITAVDRR